MCKGNRATRSFRPDLRAPITKQKEISNDIDREEDGEEERKRIQMGFHRNPVIGNFERGEKGGNGFLERIKPKSEMGFSD